MYDSFDPRSPDLRGQRPYRLAAALWSRAGRSFSGRDLALRARAFGRAVLASQRLKRWLDIAGALVLLAFFSPFLVAVCVALYVADGRPLFFTQMRVGRGRRMFPCYKMRSMVRDADAVLDRVLAADPQRRQEWAANQKLRVDPRVHRLGAILRQTSLDELPQLLNVLRGEMSLVGPRPIVADEIARLGAAADLYAAGRPGLTGLWQVSGRSDTTYEERIALDTRYVRDRTILLDIRILLRTVVVVWNGRGSC